MWSPFLLCIFVSTVTASYPAWKENTEYVYQINGRTLTGLHEIADEYSGVVLKAQLTVQLTSENILTARITDARYAQINSHLHEGWSTRLDKSQLKYEKLNLTDRPFEIVLKNSVVTDLIVDENVQNWEANMLRGIISQFQLDTNAENLISSHINQLPEEGFDTAVYKTMEETVIGKYETLYEINPLPEYILQTQPWLARVPQLKGNGRMIEIVKSKNFSHGEERVVYHYGLSNTNHWEPATNQMGESFTRSSVSRAVVSGTLKKYAIQSSETTDKIIVNPTLDTKQRGIVVSYLNITLMSVRAQSSKYEKLSGPVRLGSLVYRFNSPFTSNNQARPYNKKENYRQKLQEENNDSSSSSSLSSGENRNNYLGNKLHSVTKDVRQRRAIVEQLTAHHGHHNSHSSSSSSSHSSEENYSQQRWQQEEQKMSSPPPSPLLAYYIGYKGKSIKHSQNMNVVQAVQKLAQQIGSEMQNPEEMPKKQTLSKYAVLNSLTRIMNEEEMLEVSQVLYSKENGQASDVWMVYRDSIAECGTGPAFLTIRKWIESIKMKEEEAAQIITRMVKSVRQPTDEYMKLFYQFVTKPEILSQRVLNDSAILAYSDLVGQVYVDKHSSHNRYPVHSFGLFYSKNGVSFYKNEYIPYLAKQLQEAVSKAESHRILVYIRALGNVGHRKILSVFEEYLEGKRQISQFQRLQIVLAMDRLVKFYPKEARSVLYKIYQNPGEKKELRTAAVYQLMRTNPPASMLQRMAEYTNIDTNEQVNAAVKSAIESAAEMEGAKYEFIRSSARAARSLLTSKVYGYHYSRNQLRSYVVDEINMHYKQSFNYYGSEDSYIPKGLQYVYHIYYGDLRRQFFNLQAYVSSIEDLTNVFNQQTEEFLKKQQQQQNQNTQEAEQNKFSAEYVAKLLNIQSQENEQLEGNILIQAGGFEHFFTINNHTVELLPKALHELEELIRNGKTYKYTKFINRDEIVLSFPTEMALPFIYTFENPCMINLDGQIKFSATPKMSNGNKISKPDSIDVNNEMRFVMSSKVQGHLGFVTPFDHQQYISGYDKIMQMYLPLRSSFHLNVNDKQFNLQVEAIEPAKRVPVFHYSTWPFTSHHDILNIQPIGNQPNNRIIYSKPVQQHEHTYGQKSIGMVFNVKCSSEGNFFNYKWLYEQLRHKDVSKLMMAPWTDDELQHKHLSIQYAGDISSTRKVNVHMMYNKEYFDKPFENNADNIDDIQFYNPSKNPADRQQVINKVSSEIRSSDIYLFDSSVQFEGQQTVQYVFNTAIARSNVDRKSQIYMTMNKISNDPNSKPYHMVMSVKSYIPNTNGLDPNYALNFDPKSTIQALFAFGDNYQSAAKMNVSIKYGKSESRKQHLLKTYAYQQCKKEMETGNYQQPACAYLTQQANIMDRMSAQVETENWNPMLEGFAKRFWNKLCYLSNLYMKEDVLYRNEESRRNLKKNQNQLGLEVDFDPDFNTVNISVENTNKQMKYDNIELNGWVKQIVGFHPVFHLRSRLYSKLLGLQTYRPICSVDQTNINTFNNKSYPASIGQDWVVMLQYVPNSVHQQQYASQVENYALYIRRDVKNSNKREVKIYYRSSESEGKPVEIELKPSDQQLGNCNGEKPCATVFIIKQQIQFNEQQSTDYNNRFVQIYALPNGEVKIELRNKFYIIYDGVHVKTTLINDKFRNVVRGLCGTNNGEPSTDYRTPRNCIVRNPEEFISSYTILDNENENERLQSGRNRVEHFCFYEDISYANVISDRDTGRYQQTERNNNQFRLDTCSAQQTRYVNLDTEDVDCFTVNTLPVCRNSCSPTKMITKNVPVHCVARSNITKKWKIQIDKGANLNFSLKPTTKTVEMEVPVNCSS